MRGEARGWEGMCGKDEVREGQSRGGKGRAPMSDCWIGKGEPDGGQSRTLTAEEIGFANHNFPLFLFHRPFFIAPSSLANLFFASLPST